MNTQIEQAATFHKKFEAGFSDTPGTIPPNRAAFRHALMQEELNEYLDAAKNGTLPEIAKELADLLYTVYGTIVEHGLQEKMEEVFTEVHRSNMSKDYHEKKMIKGDGYSPANIKQFFG